MRAAAAALFAMLPLLAAQAQDQAGVRLGLTYRPGYKPALLVLPIRGTMGDSLTTILARDFDFSDRFTVVPSGAAAEISGPPNYPVFAKLGVDGIVQATLLPSGWLRVVLLDVGKRVITN